MPLVVTAGVAVVGLWILFSQWRGGRGSAPFVLSAFPFALLLAAVPIPVAAITAVQGFQNVPDNAGVHETAAFAVGIARPLLVGTIGFLVVIALAAGLQASSANSFRDAPSGPGPAPWGNWIIGVSPLLAVPVGGLMYVAHDAASLIMRAGLELSGPVGPQGSATDAIAQSAALISRRLLIAGFGGVPLTLIVCVFAVANLVCAKFTAPSRALVTYSWVVLFVAGAAAVWNVVSLGLSIRSWAQ